MRFLLYAILCSSVVGISIIIAAEIVAKSFLLSSSRFSGDLAELARSFNDITNVKVYIAVFLIVIVVSLAILLLKEKKRSTA